jgi:acyl carrier protein
MDNIKEYISEFLKNTCNVDEYDINNSILSLYLDSLDIVDLVVEIEQHYGITIDDYNDWEDMFVDDIVKYINSKINGYGEENTK